MNFIIKECIIILTLITLLCNFVLIKTSFPSGSRVCPTFVCQGVKAISYLAQAWLSPSSPKELHDHENQGTTIFLHLMACKLLKVHASLLLAVKLFSFPIPCPVSSGGLMEAYYKRCWGWTSFLQREGQRPEIKICCQDIIRVPAHYIHLRSSLGFARHKNSHFTNVNKPLFIAMVMTEKLSTVQSGHNCVTDDGSHLLKHRRWHCCTAWQNDWQCINAPVKEHRLWCRAISVHLQKKAPGN